MSENGTRLKHKRRFSWDSIASSTGWDTGVHKWHITCNARDTTYHYVLAGVVSTYPHNSKDMKGKHFWSNDCFGTVYCYCANHGCIYSVQNGSEKTLKSDLSKWSEGEVLCMVCDMDECVLSWYVNDDKLYTAHIEPHITYYPAMCMELTPHDYKLVC